MSDTSNKAEAEYKGRGHSSGLPCQFPMAFNQTSPLSGMKKWNEVSSIIVNSVVSLKSVNHNILVMSDNHNVVFKSDNRNKAF